MADIIKIKRSTTTATPSSLSAGELAYSEDSGNLFYGRVSDGTPVKIGGNTDVTKLAGIESGAQVNTVDSVASKTGAVTLEASDLTDVEITTPADGQVMVYDGVTNNRFENRALTEADISDFGSYADASHTHTKSEITDFTEADYVHVTGTESIGGDKTFSNNVVVTGNLTVNGTTTTVNSNEVNIGDSILVLNSDEAGTPSENGGIEIERGTSTNATLIWDETGDVWKAGLSGSETEISLVGHTHATTDITSGTFADARIAESNVTQHQAALSITESQISDLGSYLTDITGQSIKSLSDVYTSMTPTDGQVLTYDTTNGWQAETHSAGVTTFSGLSDTPASYTGNGGKFAKVNSAEDAIEYVSSIDGGTF